MADTLPELLRFPPDGEVTSQDYDRLATSYAHKVIGLPSTTWRGQIDDKSLLEVLDPAVNSIPYMCCLTEQLRSAASNHNQAVGLIPYTAQFFQSFDPVQVRYAGRQLRELFTLTSEAYRALSIVDIRPLSEAILRLDPSAGTFTTNHLTFLRMCCHSHQLGLALPIIDKDIHTFPSNTPQLISEDILLNDEHESSNAYINARTELPGKLSSEMVLEYYLLAAHVYIAFSRWDRAQLCLELCILHPSPHGTTSVFQVEAYKKHVLVDLIAFGKITTTSWATGQQVMKNITAVAKPYDTLAETFKLRQLRKFHAEQMVGASIWQQDGNTGLVQMVGASLLRYCIMDLKKTYAALPVSRVARHLEWTASDTLKVVQDMISSGQIDARLEGDAADPTLRFNDKAKAIVDDTTIQAQTERIQQLLQHVNDASKRLQMTREFLDASRKNKKMGADGDPADQMDLEYSNTTSMMRDMSDLADEDIMA